eukprot:5232352-Alexandrium_andersonii.AAC.1
MARADRTTRWRAAGQAASQRRRRVNATGASRPSAWRLGSAGGGPVRQARVAPCASTRMDLLECQSAAERDSAGPLMRIQ